MGLRMYVTFTYGIFPKNLRKLRANNMNNFNRILKKLNEDINKNIIFGN